MLSKVSTQLRCVCVCVCFANQKAMHAFALYQPLFIGDDDENDDDEDNLSRKKQ
jgi:hypothetical protein